MPGDIWGDGGAAGGAAAGAAVTENNNGAAGDAAGAGAGAAPGVDAGGAGTPAAGTPAAGAVAADFLTPELRSDPALAKFKTLEDLTSSYKNLQSLLGKKTMARPDANSTPEEWAQWHKDNGVPEDAKGYQLVSDLDKELPQEFISDEIKASYAKIFKDANLTPDQARSLWNSRNAFLKQQAEQVQQERAAAQEQAVGALRKEWGQDYTANLSKASAVFAKLNGGAELKTHELGQNIAVIKMMANAFPAFADDTMVQTHGNAATAISAIEGQIAAIQNNPAYRQAGHPQQEGLRQQMVALQKQLGTLRNPAK